jgi:hypothetical protein
MKRLYLFFLIIQFIYGRGLDVVKIEEHDIQENIMDKTIDKPIDKPMDKTIDRQMDNLDPKNEDSLNDYESQLSSKYTTGIPEVHNNIVGKKKKSMVDGGYLSKIKKYKKILLILFGSLLFLLSLFYTRKNKNLVNKSNSINNFNKIYTKLSQFITIENRNITVFESQTVQINMLKKNGCCFKVAFKVAYNHHQNLPRYEECIEYKISNDGNLEINKYIFNKENEIVPTEISLYVLETMEKAISQDGKLDGAIRNGIQTINQLLKDNKVTYKIIENKKFLIKLSWESKKNPLITPLTSMFIDNDIVRRKLKKSQQFHDFYHQELSEIITIENQSIRIYQLEKPKLKIEIIRKSNYYSFDLFYDHNPNKKKI